MESVPLPSWRGCKCCKKPRRAVLPKSHDFAASSPSCRNRSDSRMIIGSLCISVFPVIWFIWSLYLHTCLVQQAYVTYQCHVFCCVCELFEGEDQPRPLPPDGIAGSRLRRPSCQFHTLGSLEDGRMEDGDSFLILDAFQFQLSACLSCQNDRSLQAFVRRPRRRTPSLGEVATELQCLSFPAVQPSNLSDPLEMSGELRVQWSSTSWMKMIATLLSFTPLSFLWWFHASIHWISDWIGETRGDLFEDSDESNDLAVDSIITNTKAYWRLWEWNGSESVHTNHIKKRREMRKWREPFPACLLWFWQLSSMTSREVFVWGVLIS